jgi:hypothetical protein
VTTWERHGMCELASAVQTWHVGDLPKFGFFLLARGSRQFVIRSIPISDCSGQVASVKQSGVCDGRGEA